MTKPPARQQTRERLACFSSAKFAPLRAPHQKHISTPAETLAVWPCGGNFRLRAHGCRRDTPFQHAELVCGLAGPLP
jgi:hypothetical protein